MSSVIGNTFPGRAAGMPRVRILLGSGSGMGILRKAQRHYVQKHPHVESVKERPTRQRRRRIDGGGAERVSETYNM